jgi:hypothetical protein
MLNNALASDNNTGSFVFAVLMVLVALWLGIRVARCGVLVDDDGVRIVNPIRTVQLHWSEVSSFEFRAYGSCLVRRVEGPPVGVVGIQQSASSARRKQAGTQAAKQIAALNGLLESHRAAKHGDLPDARHEDESADIRDQARIRSSTSGGRRR